MKINIRHLAAALLLATFSLQPSALMAQGSLTPPGAPAETMKTLDQIEARTPISSAPFPISNPGSYYLTANLTVSGGDAITITANGVTLDLRGFTIASTAPSATGYGVRVNSGLSDITIYNGHIRGGVTNNGSGVYSGSGFGYGIYAYPTRNARVSGVSVSGCLNSGIYLSTWDSTVVESCTVRTVGGFGIIAATIKASVAKDCGLDAINGNLTIDCWGESSGSSSGLTTNMAQNCYGSSNTGTGLYAANTALNCHGSSSSGSYGLYAVTIAQNCYGYNNNGHGIYSATVLNCHGTSTSSYGLYAINAQNCYGSSSSGTGLFANIAQNCFGYTNGAGTGLQTDVGFNCFGHSATGTGLGFARVGAMCWGERTSPAATNYVLGSGMAGSVNLP